MQGPQVLPGKLEVLDSGALRPKKALLAVFGLTRKVDRVRRLTELSPCENCSFTPCQFRRAPYLGAPAFNYSVNGKALKRWSQERLSLAERAVQSSLYKASPLAVGAQTLLTGHVAGNESAEPVAWTYVPATGNRVVYTSLGHPDDFANPEFRHLLTNGIYWAAGLTPSAERHDEAPASAAHAH